jgi:DNA-directed RNA polymerase subunit F
MEMIDEKLVSWAEAKKILEKRAKEKELGYEQKNALEHLKKFSKTSASKVNEMIAELSKNERLKDRHIMNVVNHIPQNIDELNILFSNEIITLSEDDKKAILKVVSKFS